MPAPAGAVNADGGAGGREDRGRRRLGGEPERHQQPPHRVRLGHGAQDPPRPPAAIAHQPEGDVHDRDRQQEQANERVLGADQLRQVHISES
jgi:hypothetical protein